MHVAVQHRQRDAAPQPLGRPERPQQPRPVEDRSRQATGARLALLQLKQRRVRQDLLGMRHAGFQCIAEKSEAAFVEQVGAVPPAGMQARQVAQEIRGQLIAVDRFQRIAAGGAAQVKVLHRQSRAEPFVGLDEMAPHGIHPIQQGHDPLIADRLAQLQRPHCGGVRFETAFDHDACGEGRIVGGHFDAKLGAGAAHVLDDRRAADLDPGSLLAQRLGQPFGRYFLDAARQDDRIGHGKVSSTSDSALSQIASARIAASREVTSIGETRTTV